MLRVNSFIPPVYISNHRYNILFEDESDFYSFWAGSVIGPFVHILAIAHVLLWGLPSSVVGSVVSTIIVQFEKLYQYLYLGLISMCIKQPTCG